MNDYEDVVPEPTRDSGSPDEWSAISARYRLWMTSTLMLALATITLTIVVIIIANARDEDQQERFDATLTAVWNSVLAAPTTSVVTPTPGPVLVPGEYPLVASADSVAYSGLDTCDGQLISGRIVDQAGAPTDAFSLRVWGDFSRTRNVLTGEIANETPGAWSVDLRNAINRRLWVQVMVADRFLSAPVEVVFSGDDCARNHAVITFEQVRALN